MINKSIYTDKTLISEESKPTLKRTGSQGSNSKEDKITLLYLQACDENKILREKVSMLKRKNKALRYDNETLRHDNETQAKEIEALQLQVELKTTEGRSLPRATCIKQCVYGARCPDKNGKCKLYHRKVTIPEKQRERERTFKFTAKSSFEQSSNDGQSSKFKLQPENKGEDDTLYAAD